MRVPHSSWIATLGLYTVLLITSEMCLARAELKVCMLNFSWTVALPRICTTRSFTEANFERCWYIEFLMTAFVCHRVGVIHLHCCIQLSEGDAAGSETDPSVPLNEPTSMRSSSLEVMAALPLDGSMGLRPEEDYSYAEQPWNRSFLFGTPCGML